MPAYKYKNERKTLGDASIGNVVTIGGRDYVVLDHRYGATAVITDESVAFIPYGSSPDYAESDIRAYCNGEFYEELCKAVGKDNIIPHMVYLTTDNGSNKGVTVKDNVSIFTSNLYKQYRKVLPEYKFKWWTATRASLNKPWDIYVVDINSKGKLDRADYRSKGAVRPYCILNSSVPISGLYR